MSCTRMPPFRHDVLAGQPFPAAGELAKQLDRTLSQLLAGIRGELMTRPVYAYALTTVGFSDGKFRQTGSAPNFQGGRITLCTCKHKDRSSPPPRRSVGPDPTSPWKGVWVAGICSRRQLRPRGLFYLMLVESVFASHAQAWWGLGEPLEKSATASPFGDIYVPHRGQILNEHWQESYRKSHSKHVHDSRNRALDIERSYFARYPNLLAGDPRQSYLWSRPMVKFTPYADDQWSTAHHRFFSHLSDFLELCQ